VGLKFRGKGRCALLYFWMWHEAVADDAREGDGRGGRAASSVERHVWFFR